MLPELRGCLFRVKKRRHDLWHFPALANRTISVDSSFGERLGSRSMFRAVRAASAPEVRLNAKARCSGFLNSSPVFRAGTIEVSDSARPDSGLCPKSGPRDDRELAKRWSQLQEFRDNLPQQLLPVGRADGDRSLLFPKSRGVRDSILPTPGDSCCKSAGARFF